jgi:anaerobic magnesium-protoporphyrin IX monomethyl ester cyclase
MLDNYNISIVFPRMKYASGDPPLGPLYIATYLKRALNANVQLIDTTFHHDYSYVFKRIVNYSTDIVGIYIDTIMFNDAIFIAHMAKSLGKFVIAGGPHATIMPETVIPHVDAIIIGEGEKPLLEFLTALPSIKSVRGSWTKNEEQLFKSGELNIVDNLDDIPFPDHSFLEYWKYMQYWHYMDATGKNLKGTNIIASRGCPFHCTYCQPTLRKMFGSKLRYRSPENVVEEILELKRLYNIQSFMFQDDTFTINKKWVYEFVEIFSKKQSGIVWGCNTRADTVDKQLLREMYKAGLRKIHIGAESANERILNDIYKKGIVPEQVKETVSIAHEIGIKTLTFFMLGAPGETKKEILKTIKFARQIRSDEVTFNLTQPLPGTGLYDIISTDPKYMVVQDFTKFDYYNKRAFKDVTISNQALKLLRIIAFFYVYSSLDAFIYMIRHISSRSGIKKLFAKFKRVFS